MEQDGARPGLRERQRAETHQLIRRTAVDLALGRGASAVSVQAVCDAAGVSSRTFFNHFRTKDEALVPDLPDFLPDVEQRFVEGTEPDLVTALEHLLTGYATTLQHGARAGEGPAAMKRLLAANPELLPRVLAVFDRHERRLAELVGRRTGRPSDDLFCTVAAYAATAAMRAAFTAWHDHDARDDAGDDVTDAPGPLDTLIPEAFAVLRRLGSGPDPTTHGTAVRSGGPTPDHPTAPTPRRTPTT